MKRFNSFSEFYPFYLDEHRRRGTRVLHFAGTSWALACVVGAIVLREPRCLLVALVGAYGMAWVAHFFIEKNRPATFRYPFYSFISDFKLYFDLWTGRQRF